MSIWSNVILYWLIYKIYILLFYKIIISVVYGEMDMIIFIFLKFHSIWTTSVTLAYFAQMTLEAVSALLSLIVCKITIFKMEEVPWFLFGMRIKQQQKTLSLPQILDL